VARIAGIDLPKNKRSEIGLTYILGIGRSTARKMLEASKIDFDKKIDALTDEEIGKIREYIDQYLKVEGDLRRDVSMNIKRLVDLGCYRGVRHKKGLPVRGQRTHSNARTRKGPAVAIAGKKSIKTMK
jgi:small subunit ribosomal protein S13